MNGLKHALVNSLTLMTRRIHNSIPDLRSLLLQLGVTVIAYVYVECGGLTRSDLLAAG